MPSRFSYVIELHHLGAVLEAQLDCNAVQVSDPGFQQVTSPAFALTPPKVTLHPLLGIR